VSPHTLAGMAQPVTSPTRPAERESFVPPLLRAASDWTWRLLVVGAGLIALFLLLGYFSEIVVPLAIGVLLCALLSSVHRRLARVMPHAAAAAVTVIGTLLVILALLTLVGSQITGGMNDMARQVSDGIQQIRDYIRNNLGISDDQLGDYVEQARQWLSNANLGARLSSAGVTAGHFVAGIFIALFSLFFFLYDGPRIWAYLVRLFPRSARPYVDSSGTVAWEQLTHYVRATLLVAAVDAVGITAGALILRVPFALAIGVLVFLLSFIPIVGALLSGAVAVLIALVAQGPVTALIMLAVVVGVQQLESHVLQPFILGRSVRIHPVAVIAAIAAGAILAGIVGTLVAVPVLAVVKAVANHLFEAYNRHHGIDDDDTSDQPDQPDQPDQLADTPEQSPA
jgi:putative heme transporter